MRMKRAAWLLWQLPQSLLALCLRYCLRIASQDTHRGKTVFFFSGSAWLSGVSLGEFIFLPIRCQGDRATIAHEIGHSIQSRMLGPLYLLAVGIPSAVFNNLWDRLFHKSWGYQERIQWYYSRYPEAWADSLGGVRRQA